MCRRVFYTLEIILIFVFMYTYLHVCVVYIVDKRTQLSLYTHEENIIHIINIFIHNVLTIQLLNYNYIYYHC